MYDVFIIDYFVERASQGPGSQEGAHPVNHHQTKTISFLPDFDP